ncbi:MAG: hypothetical protein EA384_05160 [Spirochaetaceae bacterium]|nr:MAG: hypothetical protein EA384_05160 [Spirochaetaceae bacterium]
MVASPMLTVQAQDAGDPAAAADTESADPVGAAESTQPQRIDETTLLFDEPGEAASGQDLGVGPGFGVGDFVRMVLVLALVVAAIYGIFFVLKKASSGSSTDSEVIRPLASRTLPGNKSLHLVEIGRQVFLIGAADHAVNLIAEITDKESVDQLVLQAATEVADRKKSFSELLGGVLGGGRANGAPAAAGPFQFMNQQKERLRKLR